MQKLPQPKWEKWLDLDILVWLCEDGLCMRFLREGSSRHESSGRKKNEKKEEAVGAWEREMEAESKKGLQFLTYLQKRQDLGTVLKCYFSGFPLKILPCEFFLIEWKFIFC